MKLEIHVDGVFMIVMLVGGVASAIVCKAIKKSAENKSRSRTNVNYADYNRNANK